MNLDDPKTQSSIIAEAASVMNERIEGEEVVVDVDERETPYTGWGGLTHADGWVYLTAL
jgi:hypothetical protein